MNAEVERGARYLKTAAVDVVAYGCTTGSLYKGSGYDGELLKIMQTASGAPAVVEALRFLGAEKISVATPYPDWNNRRFRPYYEAAGFQVLNVEGEPTAAKAGNHGINDQSPESIMEFALRVCRPEADVLFCSCTAWPILRGCTGAVAPARTTCADIQPGHRLGGPQAPGHKQVGPLLRHALYPIGRVGRAPLPQIPSGRQLKRLNRNQQ